MNTKKRYSPIESLPETSDEFIEYAAYWLSGDAGWTDIDVEKLMKDFKEIILGELAESGKAPVLKTGDA